ncbi:hypothetical protein E4T43_04236 [Aureobasidium subglaciale]|nr:hypothetical protein E4T43_04236 [Aureobasidium subglaciale]
MMFTQSILTASVCFMTANAHLFISSPEPIAGTAIKNPLEPDGSNFPCHGVALPGSGGESMAVGSQQKLVFDAGMPAVQDPNITYYQGGGNTAVHGGGSCQISITYETDPQKVKQPSAWKTIYSIEGGCPTNSLMNLDGFYFGPLGKYSNAIPCSDAHADGVNCINDFEFTIPKGVKNGQGTLAWTWFNNVGNPEMYMNCVAVDITGGSDDASMSDFPDMFVANVGVISGGLKTNREPVQNLKFPDPGKHVTTATAITTTYMSSGVAETISGLSVYPLATPSGTGDAGSGSASATYAAGSSDVASTPTTEPVASVSYAPAPTSYAAAPSPNLPAITLVTSVSAAPVPAGTGYAGSSSSSNSTSGSCSRGKVSCSTPGELMCIDDQTFGICDVDYCAVPRPVAPGTTCSNNNVDKRDVVRRRSSRIHRHIPAHVHHKPSF